MLVYMWHFNILFTKNQYFCKILREYTMALVILYFTLSQSCQLFLPTLRERMLFA